MFCAVLTDRSAEAPPVAPTDADRRPAGERNVEGIMSEAVTEPTVLDGWMTRRELAEALGVTEDTLGRWHTRRIGPPTVKIGRRALYRREAVREWMVTRERNPGTEGRRP